MKAALIAMLLLPLSAFAATNFNFYASPKLAYSCSGYRTATCVGFETSDPLHPVTMGIIQAISQNPLQFLVHLYVNGNHYRGTVQASNAGFPFLLTDDGPDTIMLTITYATTKHCVGKSCVPRYLLEQGTVSIP